MQERTFKVEGRLVASNESLLSKSLFIEIRRAFYLSAEQRHVRVEKFFLNQGEGCIEFCVLVDAGSWSACSEQIQSLLQDVFVIEPPATPDEDALVQSGQFEEDGIAYSYA